MHPPCRPNRPSPQFGRLAGRGAVRYLGTLASPPRVHDEQVAGAARRATDILNRENGTNPYLIHEDLQNVMGRYVGIVRTEEELKTALIELERLKADAARVKAHGTSQYNAGWHQALDLRSLLITGEVVTRAALARQESRGAHTRVDYPGERDEWLKVNVVVRKGAEGLETRTVDRPAPPAPPAAIAYAKIEELEGAHV